MNIIFYLLALMLPTNSVDAIVSVLDKLAKRLATAEAAQAARAAALRSRAAEMLVQADDADAEGERASRVRARLSDLVA
ncbi:hypothetical protein P0F65_13555 [Sphingomonas sp. I4]